MAREILRDKYVQRSAAETGYTADELKEVIETLHDSMQSRLNTHYKNCWLSGGLNYLVAELEDERWFGMTVYELKDEAREAGLDTDTHKLRVVAQIHLDNFQNVFKRTVRVSKSVGQQYSEPLFYPIYVRESEERQNAKYNVVQQFHNNLLYFEMSPAEALDYWAIVEMEIDTNEWARYRRVDTEAVRKNVRQAKEKYSDEEMGRNRDVNTLSTAPIEEVPESRYDDEYYYTPTRKHGGNFEEGLDDY